MYPEMPPPAKIWARAWGGCVAKCSGFVVGQMPWYRAGPGVLLPASCFCQGCQVGVSSHPCHLSGGDLASPFPRVPRAGVSAQATAHWAGAEGWPQASSLSYLVPSVPSSPTSV